MGLFLRDRASVSNPLITENVHIGLYLFILREGHIDAEENDE